ncbi:hypothetical protein Pan216_29320 [Planctomycetes bacterium Pan216]|uniref:Uncharacterized protein n=1 Tax=Kolteria novifilia TaxID=2527975 RepID=A0A518B544_9BACT|nr:hypothetical protein Pan216_29320 [Planctomycetes bacterium Pan216]
MKFFLVEAPFDQNNIGFCSLDVEKAERFPPIFGVTRSAALANEPVVTGLAAR